MRKMTLTFTVGLFVAIGFLFTPTSTRAVIFPPASTCQATNLGQALQGIGWSQFGVRNNAETSIVPLRRVTSFLVVCPLIFDHLTLSNPTAQKAHVWATFPGPTPAGAPKAPAQSPGIVECTARFQDLFGAFTSHYFEVNAGSPPVVGLYRGANFSATTDLNFTINATVVCALDPGEGIEATYID